MIRPSALKSLTSSVARIGAALLFSVTLLTACGGGSSADMKRTAEAGHSRAYALNVAAAGSRAAEAVVASPTELQVLSVVKVAKVRISRTVFEYSFQVRVHNPGSVAYDNVVLRLASVDAGASIRDDTVAMGSIPAGAELLSEDTVVIRQDRLQGFDPAAWVWQIDATPVAVPALEFNLAYQAAPADNPMKGLVSYRPAGGGRARDFPYSLEWFHIALKDVQTGYNTFDWTLLDQQIADVAARGKQVVFSTYLDYPRHEPGTPAFLAELTDPPLIKNDYDYNGNGQNGAARSYSPDYTDPRLQLAVLNYIAALGARYDNDPRVAFISAGLIGFWGEWHTFPMNEWVNVPGFMEDVLRSYDAAFKNKFIIAREPKSGVRSDWPRLGYSDGSFAYQTNGPTSWHFWPKLTTAGLSDLWQTRPIGGEVYPGLGPCIWKDPTCSPLGQEFDLSVTTTKASWVVANGTFLNNEEHQWSEADLQRATASAQRLGYTLHIPRASVVPPRSGQALAGTVFVENRGVAPFYYPWQVRIAVMDASGTVSQWPISADLRSVLPGTPGSWNFEVTDPGLAAGTYKLLIGVANPMTGGKPLRFANTTQDQDQNGWLTLGSFEVTP